MWPLFELAIALPPKGSRSVLHSLQRQLRAAIADGRLKPGLQLPATRALAKLLGISRNTVIAAYDLLQSEGYLIAHGGSGTFVAEARPALVGSSVPLHRSETDCRIAAYWRGRTPITDPSLRRTCRYDFRTGVPDVTRFPFQVWQRLSTRAARAFGKEGVVLEAPQGREALREAIARHVSLARAVACRSDDIVVTSGTRHTGERKVRLVLPSSDSQRPSILTPWSERFDRGDERWRS